MPNIEIEMKSFEWQVKSELRDYIKPETLIHIGPISSLNGFYVGESVENPYFNLIVFVSNFHVTEVFFKFTDDETASLIEALHEILIGKVKSR